MLLLKFFIFFICCFQVFNDCATFDLGNFYVIMTFVSFVFS